MIHINCKWIFLLTAVLFQPLFTSAQIKDLSGIYLSKTNPLNERIILHKNGNFVIIYRIDHVLQYTDTLTYGVYKRKGTNVIEFNSDLKGVPNVLAHYVTMHVQESVGRSEDSIYFLINNKLEDEIKAGKTYGVRPINYHLHFTTENAERAKDRNSLFSNRIQLPKFEVENFSVSVIPDVLNFYGNLTVNHVFTEPYAPVNKQSNIFSIDISQIDLRFFSIKRLNADYAFLKENSIVWEGEVYEKEK